ncbi:MAG: 4Fe-4S binding protein [Christiangramia sp.]|uniref:4Fe-4S binding protein n=1 Tax=Christiangramia sp. TaxID=1931228 RepID=UPI00324232D1
MIRKLTKRSDGVEARVLKPEVSIRKVRYSLEGNSIEFSNGTTEKGTCINCHSKPCLNLPKNYLNNHIIDGLPHNNDPRVCPVNAISYNGKDGIEINSDCIGCGLCMTRCPIGGIEYDNYNQSFKVSKTDSEYFVLADSSQQASVESTYLRITEVSKDFHTSKIPLELTNNLQEGLRKKSLRFPDLELIMIRNYLLSLGIKSTISAKGNIDSRMDFTAELDEYTIPGESSVQGNDILGLPRRILEDISWLHNRIGIPKQKQIPLLIINEFPRKRSDFYEVISDIENVLGIEIKVLTLHFLFAMNLFGKKVYKEQLKTSFTINKNNFDFTPYFRLYIPNIEKIDEAFGSELYTFSK